MSGSEGDVLNSRMEGGKMDSGLLFVIVVHVHHPPSLSNKGLNIPLKVLHVGQSEGRHRCTLVHVLEHKEFGVVLPCLSLHLDVPLGSLEIIQKNHKRACRHVQPLLTYTGVQ